MQLTPYGMSLIISPLEKKSIVVTAEGKSSEGHGLARVEEVGEGGYDGEKWFHLPFVKGDIIAFHLDAARPFKIGKDTHWRINFDGIFCKVEGFDITGYQEVEV